MKNTGIVMPMIVFTSIFLSACGQRERTYQPYTSFGSTAEKSTRTEPFPEPPAETAAQHEGSGSTGEKPLPKLVPVKSFSERPAEKMEFYTSTVPASAVIINVNPAPGAVPAPEPAAAPEPAKAPAHAPAEKIPVY